MKLYKPVYKALIAKRPKISPAAIKALIDKEVFTVQEEESSRLLQNDDVASEKSELNEAQALAYKEIKESFQTHDITLLHGVTSSGKTEIYIHLIEEQLKAGKQVLYLLPEIALTTQIINRLRRVFAGRVGVYHSKFSDSERVEIWNNLLGKIPAGAQKYDVILGVRSSVFLPFTNLGLIIVDEEHENIIEIGELMARDALMREESCGGHFREEHQTEEGEAKRNDSDFMFVGAWEYKGEGREPELHKESLVYENIKVAQRNYKK